MAARAAASQGHFGGHAGRTSTLKLSASGDTRMNEVSCRNASSGCSTWRAKGGGIVDFEGGSLAHPRDLSRRPVGRSPLECRAAQSRQARPEGAQGWNSGTARRRGGVVSEGGWVVL